MIASSAEHSPAARSLLGSIEYFLEQSVTWGVVLAILVVPLVVLPESEFTAITNLPKVTLVRMIAGAIAVCLVIKAMFHVTTAATQGDSYRVRQCRLASETFHLFLNKDAIWLPITTTMVLAATFISAAFSIHQDTSLWGIDPGTSQRDLYTSGAYFMIFIGAALASRSMKNIGLFSRAIALGGTISAVIGVAQYFGFSLFGISGTYGERLTGTAGNPIFFGSILVITFPFLVFSIATWSNKNGHSSLYWSVLTMLAVLFFFSAAGTASRAILVIIALVGIAILVGLAVELGRKKVYPYGLSLLIALLISVLLNVTIPSNVKGNSGPEISIDGSLEPVLSRNRLDRDHLTGITDSRFSIWSTTLEMTAARPQSSEWDSTSTLVRHLVGYGPDTFRYTHQYAVGGDRINVTTSHAHNEFLDRWIELGLFGFASWIALWAASIGTGVFLLARARRARTTAFIPTAILVALGGITLSYMSGIPAPGDTVLFWTVLGMLSGQTVHRLANDGPKNDRPSILQRAVRKPFFPPMLIVIVIPVVMLAVLLSWSRNVPYLQASSEAANALQAPDYASAESRLSRAIDLAPNVVEYYAMLGHLDTDAADNAITSADALAAHLRAYAVYESALDSRPFDRQSNFKAAQSAWSAASGGDVTFALEAIAIYEKLERLTPNDPILSPRLEAMRSTLGGIGG